MSEIIDVILSKDEDQFDVCNNLPGTFGCHEALERTWLLARMVDDLADHAAIKSNLDWSAKAENISDLLNGLYQDIALAHSDARSERSCLIKALINAVKSFGLDLTTLTDQEIIERFT